MSDMQIESTTDGECINIHSDKDISVMASNNEDITITQNRTINVLEGTHTESIKGDTKITIESGTYQHDVAANTADYHVKGAVTEVFDDKQTTAVANEIEITTKTAHIFLTGSTSIHLHVGDSQICMGSDGSIMIQGKHVQIIGSDKVEISGGEVISKADTMHEISGATVKSAATNTNTVSGATAVMLNP
jgi:type VI secretion system secreted protein VgrG